MPSGRYHIRPNQMRGLLLLLVLLPVVPTVLALRFMAETTRTQSEDARERIETLYRSHLSTLSGYLPSLLLGFLPSLSGEPLERIPVIAAAQGKVAATLIYSREGKLLWPVAETPGEDSTGRLVRLFPALPPDFAMPLGHWESVPGTDLYAVRQEAGQFLLVFARKRGELIQRISSFCEEALGPQVTVKILAPGVVQPAIADAESLRSLPPLDISNILPGWKLQLTLSVDNEIEVGLREQVAAFRRIGIAVVSGLLLISAAAAFAVNRQLRIHELRNTALAAVAHELKTPVSSTRLLVDTLLQQRYHDPARIQEYLTLIDAENSRIAKTVEGFLTLSRMEQKQYPFRLERVRPEEIVEQAVEVLKVPLTAEHCHFEKKVERGLPAIQCDRDALAGALVNLLENALKYSRAEKEISLEVRSQSGSVLFAVADRGVGVAPQDRRLIFLPFRQADNRLARSREGCGLGLGIATQVMKAHRGKIWTEPRPEGGSIFYLSIPARGSTVGAEPLAAEHSSHA